MILRPPSSARDVAGETVTVITRRYIAVLKRFLWALNSKCAGTLNQKSFQEDGPATHTRTSRDNLAWLQDRFRGRLFLTLRLRELATMFAGFHRSRFFRGVPEEYCAPGGTRNLENFERGDPCGHSRDLPSLMFGRGSQTPSNAVWPRNTDTSSTCLVRAMNSRQSPWVVSINIHETGYFLCWSELAVLETIQTISKTMWYIFWGHPVFMGRLSR